MFTIICVGGPVVSSVTGSVVVCAVVSSGSTGTTAECPGVVASGSLLFPFPLSPLIIRRMITTIAAIRAAPSEQKRTIRPAFFFFGEPAAELVQTVEQELRGRFVSSFRSLCRTSRYRAIGATDFTKHILPTCQKPPTKLSAVLRC